MFPVGDLIAGERHGGAEGLAVGTVPADHDGVPARPPAGLAGRFQRGQGGLGRLPQLDRGEPPAVAEPAVAPQDRGRLPDLLRRQRIERI
jgi:hypothetical protein